MRDIAIVGFAQTPSTRRDLRDDVEMVQSVVSTARQQSGIGRHETGFTVSGSCDFLAGAPFAFVGALDAIGAWPPIRESHVEMDGAFALYEVWVRLMHGDIDTALVYCFGKSSCGDPAKTAAMQLDPYTLAPLWPDAIALAAMQAQAGLDSGRFTKRDIAEVVARSRVAAADNPMAQLRQTAAIEALLDAEMLVDPLHMHDCPPISDGAAAMVIAAGDAIRRSACERPVYLRSMEHRIDHHAPGWRDLSVSPSTARAGEAAGVHDGKVDFAELHAPFAHQEIILRQALELGSDVTVNPSGGALCANPLMVAGLVRIGDAAARIMRGEGDRAVAHATSGPCLQHNLVCVLEGS